MMKTKHFAYERCDRLNALIKEEVSDIILNHLNDPRIGFVTVTEVKVAHDLHYATIYVSFYGSDKKEGMEGLTHAIGFIRTELGKRIKMRYTPEIAFKLDTSIESGAHVLEIIDSLEIPENHLEDQGNMLE
ncbi:MAG: 30S ribosome-binding factor RbfA [bacterium]|nr:30S ribosome-binding factor RbfA [bacterium]